MENDSRFRRLAPTGEEAVTLSVEGRPVTARAGESVAAALLAAGILVTRTTPVSGAPRAPFCLMGACFDCLMEIDGVSNRQACTTTVRDGMTVARQHGVAAVTENTN